MVESSLGRLDKAAFAFISRQQRPVLALLVTTALTVALCFSLSPMSAAVSEPVFTVQPYLQLGNHPALGKSEAVEICWIAANDKSKWLVESRSQGGAGATKSDWKAATEVRSHLVWNSSTSSTDNLLNVLSRLFPPLHSEQFAFSGTVSGLSPGQPFIYRILRDNQEVFRATGTARKSFGEPYQFVVFGDMGANSAGQRAVASQIYKCKPDFIVCAGDIVYTMGLFSEYLEKFFPIYNTAEIGSAQPPNGVPLLRSTISFGVIGNHDVAFGDNREGVNLDKFKDDGLAFFKIWSSPLNGPTGDLHAQNVPKLLGSEAQISRYTDSVGAKYPRMSNYSFNYGNAHWLVLDANPYMDWRDPLLRKWVKKDLADAKDATWKFVCFHQPGFSYDAAHYQEQRMRLLCDLFDTGNVDVVFSGHAHDYQRSFPLKFTATRKNGQPTINTDGTVDGAILLDKDYDGEKNQHPSGIIYLVSGAGGAPLYGPISIKNPNIPRTFTKIFDSDHHSFTDCVVSGNSLAIKQIAGDGTIVDSFNIQKAPSRKDNPVSSNRKKVRNTP